MIFKPGEGSEPEAPALAETLRSQWNMALRQGLRRYRRKSLPQAGAGLDVTRHIDDLVQVSGHWIVLHDMKFRWRERTAQVDHLLINRQLEIHLVHARLLHQRTRCREGRWQAWQSGQWQAIPSPVEHCRRKLFVLRKLVESERLAPHHHGVALPVSFKNLVLVGPDFESSDPPANDTMVWNLDTLATQLRHDISHVGAFFTTLPPEILDAFGQRLLAWHHHEPRLSA